MRNLVLIILFIVISATQIYSAKLHSFFDISKPRMFWLDNEFIYIAERTTHSVNIYDLKNFNLIKKLCKKGEGPEELITPPCIHKANNKIFISDQTKVIIYSNKFKFLQEIKPGILLNFIIPVQDHFALMHDEIVDNRDYKVLTFLDEKFKKIKKISLSPKSNSEYLFFPITIIRSWKDRVYVYYHDKGFYIGVYNKNGDKLYSIEKKIDKVTATEKHKQRFIEFLFEALGNKLFNKMKASKRFDKPLPEYLPDIKNFWVVDDKIYVKTYDVNDNNDNDKYIILDIKGEILDTKFLPKAYYNRFSFSNNKFFYLVDNDEKECWDLYMIEL